MPKLIPHPDFPPAAIQAVEADIRDDGNVWHIDYRVTGDIAKLALPAPQTPQRKDGLWEATCFELFVASPGKPYREFNFSPSGCFAAYTFEAYRSGRRDGAATISINTEHDEDYLLSACLAANLTDARLLAPTAIIVEEGGRKSYWALGHPDGDPDFHDPAGFLLAKEDI
ncbi:DOMON-like domain-containing protein [Sphingomicrobium flavum]|uniref:DOMON-like domain-containing protein n=1 Tax=Sphingomicrobium flavum TaxID=1229164 RepID=UPI0021ADA7FD|nr:DOMON-like domain-containing protein [Sphingomicrobium flavum]